MRKNRLAHWCQVLCSIALLLSAPAIYAADANKIVKDAYDYWRDLSSLSVVEMTIHRPTWDRSIRLRVSTEGRTKSLARVEAPPKDAGTSTLIIDQEMWTYSPKINQVVKVPSSMMVQSWMGSDFSNLDITKAENVVEWYTHKLLGVEQHNGKQVFVVESIPKKDVPIVWGKEILKIRADNIVLEHLFYDQDMQLKKRLITLDIDTQDGKLIPVRQRMAKIETPQEWTELLIRSAQFNLHMPESTFTLSNLRNPRR